MSFVIMTVAFVGVACLNRFIFEPESAIASVFLLGELGGVLILLIKLGLGVLILILFMISPNRNLHPFLPTPSFFLGYISSLWTVLLEDQVLIPWVKFLPQLQK